MKLGSLLCHIRKDVKVKVNFVLCPGGTGNQPARAGGLLESREVFFPSVLLRASRWKQLSRDAGRKAAAGTTFVCVFADK